MTLKPEPSRSTAFGALTQQRQQEPVKKCTVLGLGLLFFLPFLVNKLYRPYPSNKQALRTGTAGTG